MLMTLIKLYIVLCLLGTVTTEHAYAPHYAKGVMERVSHNRNMPVVPCMIASPTLPIGAWVWVYGKGTGALQHCRVTDTSAPRDKARHIRLKRVELSYSAAQVLCSTMRGKPEECEILVIRV